MLFLKNFQNFGPIWHLWDPSDVWSVVEYEYILRVTRVDLVVYVSFFSVCSHTSVWIGHMALVFPCFYTSPFLLDNRLESLVITVYFSRTDQTTRFWRDFVKHGKVTCKSSYHQIYWMIGSYRYNHQIYERIWSYRLYHQIYEMIGS